jgi:tetratricopeptide (TPR) repeat protein
MADHIFVCYSKRDREFASGVVAQLKQLGLPIWLDQFDIVPGDQWQQSIESALLTCKSLIVILSPDAVASPEVNAEWRAALDAGKMVLPILHRQCDIPIRLRLIQYVDFTNRPADWRQGIEQVVFALNRASARPLQVVAPASKKRAMALVWAGVVAAAAVAGGLFYSGQLSPPAEPQAQKTEPPKVESPKTMAPVEDAPQRPVQPRPVQPRRESPTSTPTTAPVTKPDDPQPSKPAPAVQNPVSLAEQGRCKEAIGPLERDTRVDDKNPNVSFWLGRCQYETGNFDGAISSLTAALRQNDRIPDYFRYRGLARWKNHDLNGALSDLTEAIKLDPDRIAPYLDRGRVYEDLRDFQSAVNDYRKATRIAPESRPAQIALGKALIKNGDKQLGEEILRRAGAQ